MTSLLLPPDNQAAKLTSEIDEVRSGAGRSLALLDMAMFPAFMLVCYIILIVYFAARGGYKPVDLLKNVPDDQLPSEDGVPVGDHQHGIHANKVRSTPR